MTTLSWDDETVSDSPVSAMRDVRTQVVTVVANASAAETPAPMVLMQPSLPQAEPLAQRAPRQARVECAPPGRESVRPAERSEEHTSELQSL